MNFIKHKIRAGSCIVFLFASFSIFAQTESEKKIIQQKLNQQELQRLGDLFAQEYKENRAKTLRYAKIFGWETTKTSETGTFMELHGITEDLKPIYFEAANRDAGITARANRLYSGGGLGLNVEGQNMTAGMWDRGALRVTHESFTGRATQMDGTTLIIDHSNWVGGAIIASDQFQNGDVRGMAFKANLNGYSYQNEFSEVTGAAAAGLLLSNHSYEYGHTGTYTNEASTYDLIMQNAPTYLAVFAAGNYGPTQYTVTNLAAGKNSLSVAAVEDVLVYNGPTSVTPVSYTSVGPTGDGRIKPDISANGWIMPTIDGVSDNAYACCTHGTSMSAPSATGTLLLLQQYYNQVNSNFMLAASLKALAIHSVDEAGANPGPDIKMGWGLINAERAANIITDNGSTAYIEENTLMGGGTYTKTVTASGYEPLIVTICWTDPAAAASPIGTSAPRLIHDLDVRVDDGVITSLPWKLDPTNVAAAAIRGDNFLDNVEKIEIPNPTPGQTYTITINHKGTLTTSSQNYGLVISGVTNCQNSLVIATDVFGIDHQEAISNITASNTIINGAEGVYHAGDEVLLVNDFTSENGSVFRAYIEGCSSSFVKSGTVSNNSEGDLINESNYTEIVDPISPLSINEPANSITMKITPNPNNGEFNVNLSQISNGLIRVSDINGRIIFERKYKNENQMFVDIEGHEAGMYVLQVITKDNILTKKIIKR